MGLDLSSDQIIMRDEAARLLAQRVTTAALRNTIDAGAFDRELWKTVGSSLGWCAIAIPEDCGGLGRTMFDLVLLAEQIGRRLAPIPFWSTAGLAAPVIAATAQDNARKALLARIAAGEAATVAFADPGRANPAIGTTITASRRSDGYVLEGSAPAVFDLDAAQIVIVPARLDDGSLALFSIARDAGFAVEPQQNLDLTRPVAALTFHRIIVPSSARIDRGQLIADDLVQPLQMAKLALAAEQVGTAQGCFDLTLSYIAERRQFDRTIASFQAIKHRCARLLVDLAEARSLLYGAANSLDSVAADAALDIAASGALASRALFGVAEESIQLHGGVGMTWEYDPHLYLRRAQASSQLFGSPDMRLEALADRLLGPAL